MWAKDRARAWDRLIRFALVAVVVAALPATACTTLLGVTDVAPLEDAATAPSSGGEGGSSSSSSGSRSGSGSGAGSGSGSGVTSSGEEQDATAVDGS